LRKPSLKKPKAAKNGKITIIWPKFRQTKLTIKKLQKGTAYYVRIRYSDGAGGYSQWSKVRKVKTKKK
jgi:hypothetical protein